MDAVRVFRWCKGVLSVVCGVVSLGGAERGLGRGDEGDFGEEDEELREVEAGEQRVGF